MKYITFTVPCYNSEAYMGRCINSLLVCGDMAEIIIVDDGSADGTGSLADEYSRDYPDIVKVIHQENKGHGSGVNAGLAAASGTYFKVVDSDDWLDKKALIQLMKLLKQWEERGKEADLLVCNYVYDHLYEGKQKVMNYRNVLKDGSFHTWSGIGHFHPSQYLIMHALIFRTEVLRQSKVQLPEHTFYVDNIFANQPLPYVKTIYYRDLNLYHYFLGREDQSVNEEVLKRRIDQQIRVTKLVAECTDWQAVLVDNPVLANYLIRNVSVMMAISSVHLLLINSEEAWKKRQELWSFVQMNNGKLYRKLKYGCLSGLTMLPGRAGRLVTLAGYRAANRMYRFN